MDNIQKSIIIGPNTNFLGSSLKKLERYAEAIQMYDKPYS